jgi:hypothetical protein
MEKVGQIGTPMISAGIAGAAVLERWDWNRKKWVLYRTVEEHSADCDRYPSESIPKRVFLDTNVLNILIKHSSQVFEQVFIPGEIEPTKAEDIEALMHVFHFGARMNWDLVASRKSLDELEQTPDGEHRADLLDYAINLVDTQSENALYAADLGRRLVDAPFTAALPDAFDRELIGNAIGFGCDVFCTCDRRTIIRKRDQLAQLPIQILTPAEWWARVKPWGGAWM